MRSSHPSRNARLILLIATLAGGGALIACGGDDSSTASPATDAGADASANDAHVGTDATATDAHADVTTSDASDAAHAGDASDGGAVDGTTSDASDGATSDASDAASSSDGSDGGAPHDASSDSAASDAGSDSAAADASSDSAASDAGSDSAASDAGDAATGVSVFGSLFDMASVASSSFDPPLGSFSVCLAGASPSNCTTVDDTGFFSVDGVSANTRGVLIVHQTATAIDDAGVEAGADAGDGGAPTYLDVALAFTTDTNDDDLGYSPVISTTYLAAASATLDGGAPNPADGVVVVGTYDTAGSNLAGVTLALPGNVFYATTSGLQTAGPTTDIGYGGALNVAIGDAATPVAQVTATASSLTCTIYPGGGWAPVSTETVDAPLFANTVTIVSVSCN